MTSRRADGSIVTGPPPSRLKASSTRSAPDDDDLAMMVEDLDMETVDAPSDAGARGRGPRGGGSKGTGGTPVGQADIKAMKSLLFPKAIPTFNENWTVQVRLFLFLFLLIYFSLRLSPSVSFCLGLLYLSLLAPLLALLLLFGGDRAQTRRGRYGGLDENYPGCKSKLLSLKASQSYSS